MLNVVGLPLHVGFTDAARVGTSGPVQKEVITLFPVPLPATATNIPLAYTTLTQLLSAGVGRSVHVIASGLVITLFPVPKLVTPTNKPLP